MLHAATHVDGKVLWANLFLLFWLSLIPFVIRWIDESHFEALPIAGYGIVVGAPGKPRRGSAADTRERRSPLPKNPAQRFPSGIVGVAMRLDGQVTPNPQIEFRQSTLHANSLRLAV
jgi:hypothetical protein